MRCQVANTLTIKFMSAHFLTDNCEKVFSSWHTVILTHTPHYSAAEQCKATHPVCVTLTYGTPASLNQTESLHQSSIDPHSFGPTPLIRSASFSCYTHRCRQPNRSLLPSQPPPPLNSPSTIRTSNRTSFLLVYSHTSETTHWGKPCWLNPYGQYKAKSRVSRPRSQSAGPRNQTLRRVINTAESPGLVKGQSIQTAFPPSSQQRHSHTWLPRQLSWLLPLVPVRFHIQPTAFDHASLQHTHITISN